MIEFATALCMARPPFLCVVTAGGEEDFLRAALDAPVPGRRILADGEGARRVAFVANDLQVAVPPIEPTRGLTRDLDALLRGGIGPLTILPDDTVRRHVADRARRLHRDLEIFAGYQIPPGLIRASVVAELRALIVQIAHGGHSPLLLHDCDGLVRPGDVPGAMFWADPATPPLARDEVEPREATDADHTEDDIGPVDPDVVLEQARFLAETDPATLRRMQPGLVAPACEPLRAFWAQQLARLETDPEHEEVARAAVASLGRAFGTTAPTGGPTSHQGAPRRGHARRPSSRRW